MFFETVLSCNSPFYYKISKYRQRGKSHPPNLIMEKCVLNVFETVKYGVNCREPAERYDMEVNRYGMAICPLHNDRYPGLYL